MSLGTSLRYVYMHFVKTHHFSAIYQYMPFRRDTSLGILVDEAAYWPLVELQLSITMRIVNSLDCYMTLPFKLGSKI